MIRNSEAGVENCVICTINPGKHPGKLCCKREGRRIIFETSRQQTDKEPVNVREEIYPSEECVDITFRALETVLEKGAGKSNRLFLLSF